MKNKELTEFCRHQLSHFDLAAKNYAALKKAVYKDIQAGAFSIRLQHNPARILSTNAKVDTTSILARNCFLCPTYRPEGQDFLPYGENYQILLNPYPIFTEHFTVAANTHMPQLLSGHFEDLLHLAIDFEDYTVFYNGPSCGASAPDHLHFQLVPRQQMPLESDVWNDKNRHDLLQEDFFTLSTLRDYLRPVLILRASDLALLSSLFSQCLEIIGQEIPATPEPMVNVLAWFDNCQWTVCIFPRKLRRPWQFEAEGKEKILFSPGCVDMAGLIISPREEDFNRYSAAILQDLFRQVCPDQITWKNILRQCLQIKP